MQASTAVPKLTLLFKIPLLAIAESFLYFKLNKLRMDIKRYAVFLDEMFVGTTALEKADAPMGVVFGVIDFATIISGYDFFKKYCRENNIELSYDYPDDKCIATQTIQNLCVKSPEGIVIEGLGKQISGMDDDYFEIEIVGIAYPFFEEEFPHHVKAYENQFKANPEN